MYRVLIAEEDVLTREVLEQILSRQKEFCMVQTADSCAEAVRLGQESGIDLVFVGIQLPDGYGLDLARVLLGIAPEAAVCLLVPRGGAEQFRERGQKFIRQIIEKPVQAARIAELLEQYHSVREHSIQKQAERLIHTLREKDFRTLTQSLPDIVDAVYQTVEHDPGSQLRAFTYLGRSVLNSRTAAGQEAAEKLQRDYPINTAEISNPCVMELWLFRLMNDLFCRNSITRYPLLENIFPYISDHLEEDITLNSITENCNISQGYLSRIIREQFHVSVMEYLHLRKIQMAKELFCFTEYSNAEVAFRLGYNESSYFSKIFKKYESITIKEYRRRVQRHTGVT